MYDSVPVDDLDFEDIEWQKWLQGLVNSGIYHVHVGASLMMCKFSMLKAFYLFFKDKVGFLPKNEEG